MQSSSCHKFANIDLSRWCDRMDGQRSVIRERVTQQVLSSQVAGPISCSRLDTLICDLLQHLFVFARTSSLPLNRMLFEQLCRFGFRIDLKIAIFSLVLCLVI